VPVMTSIVADRVSGKELPHECGKSRLTAFEKDMRMIGHQRPGIEIFVPVFKATGPILDTNIPRSLSSATISLFSIPRIIT